MRNVWSLLFGQEEQPTEKRFTIDQAAEWVKYSNHTYFSGSGSTGKEEAIGNSFQSYVQHAYKSNGIVFACQVARMMVFSQARFLHQRMIDGRPGDLFYRDDLRLLEKPWPMGTTEDLLTRAIQDVDLAGNHYVVVKGSGREQRIRRLRPDWVTILLTRPPEEALESDIEAYVYRPGGGSDPENWELFPVDGTNGAIAHWAPIPDPTAQYMGMSWLTPVVREITADTAATIHKGKFFENGGTPNLVFSVHQDVTPEQFAQFIEITEAKTQGLGNAYKNLHLGGGADVTVVGKDLAQLDFKVTQGAGETRIAAAARVHPTIVGLSEGMQGSSLNAGNYGVAKRAFADGTLRPLWSSLCGAYASLLKERPKSRLWYDSRDIDFLREDEKDLAGIQSIQSTTINNYIREGWTPESAKAAVINDDVSLLEHSGLVSVQLQKPGSQEDPSNDSKEVVDDE